MIRSAISPLRALLVFLLVACWIAPGCADPATATSPPGTMADFQRRLESAPALLSADDKAAFADAYDAANRGNWPRAQELAAELHNPIAAKFITWAYLTSDDTSPTFDEITRFIDKNHDWPLQDVLLEKAEKAIPDEMPPARVVAWFAGQEPYTGEGMVRLGAALIATGDKDYGARWLALAWSAHDFDTDEQKQIYDKYKDYLRGQPTLDRVDYLLWTSQYDEASALLSELPDSRQRIAKVRIALMKLSSDALARVSALPLSEQQDPGVIFDQARYLRRTGNDDAARAMLLSVKDPEKVPYPDKWWIERQYQARNALDEQAYEDAYKLLSKSGLTSGASFAEAEWLAGWVALRFLKQPQVALDHFKKLEASVTYPVSLARADYWAGQAAEALGDTTLATKSYEDAAAFPFTFYGQLAASSALLANERLALPDPPQVDPSLWPDFLNNELVVAIRLIHEIGGDRYMRTLGYDLADKAKTPADLEMLTELFKDIDKTAISLRIAKYANEQHTPLTDYLFPLVKLPSYLGTSAPPEPVLVLAIMRQESEFNPAAVSSAGAIGLMQLLPATARLTANKNGFSYHSKALLSDPDYNMQVGMAHLSDLLSYYNGSYVLAIAAYNAGVNNVDAWIAEMGDPRDKNIDPVDWIEAIPFTETRNYVERVLENISVYRARMAGRPVVFELEADLRRSSSNPPDLSYLDKSAPAPAPAPVAPPAPSAPSQTVGAQPPAPAASTIEPTKPENPDLTLPQPASEVSLPEDSRATGQDEDAAAPMDQRWNIPASCAHFVVLPDHSAQCVE